MSGGTSTSTTRESADEWTARLIKENVVGVHPAADMLPDLPANEFEQLKADIEDRGLLEPILMKRGHVVDGRHRLRACAELGIPPRFEEYHEDDIVHEIVSRNIFRRHLTARERADLVAKMCGDKLIAEADARRKSNLRHSSNVSTDTIDGSTREKVAKLARVSPATAQRAIAALKRKQSIAKKPRRKTILPFDQDVIKRIDRWLDHWPVTQHRAVRKIVREYFATHDPRPAAGRGSSTNAA
jgi:ParB/Sulfiredoxin domain